MQVEEGKILSGKITGITSFGAFVELEGGVTGLVHIHRIHNVGAFDGGLDSVNDTRDLINRIGFILNTVKKQVSELFISINKSDHLHATHGIGGIVAYRKHRGVNLGGLGYGTLMSEHIIVLLVLLGNIVVSLEVGCTEFL